MDSRDHLSLLPEDVQLSLRCYYLNDSSIFNFAKTSKHWRFICVEFAAEIKEDYKKIHKRFQELARSLLNHSALGEWDMAAKIWRPHPFLLNFRGTVYHPNPLDMAPYMSLGRYKYVDHTATKIAWANDEYAIGKEMTACMDAKESQTQYDELFPDGIITKYDWCADKFRELVEELFVAIMNDDLIQVDNTDQMQTDTRLILYAVYDCIMPKEHQKGVVCDPIAYEIASQLFDERAKELNVHQRVFWNIRVEEVIASCLGTGYLRPHSQGAVNQLDKNGCFIAEDKSSYFSCHRGSRSVPGFHFFVNLEGKKITGSFSSPDGTRYAAPRGSPFAGGQGKLTTALFKDLRYKKQQQRLELMEQYSQPNNSKNIS